MSDGRPAVRATGVSPVAVVTDSAASLPTGMAAALGVSVVPMSLSIGSEVYPDGSIDPGELLSRPGDETVTTSAPSPGAYVAALDALDGRPAVIVTVSQRMSASYESATTAARYLRSGDVVVVDSRTAAGGQGLVVSAAAREAARGRTLAAVAAASRGAVARVRLLACLERLDHLARSGRVPGVAAWAGRSLGVRPVFEFAGGVVHPRRPAASMRRAMERFVAACHEEALPGARLHAAVLHSGAPEAAEALRSRVASVAPEADVFAAGFSSVMVAHTGSGLAGLAWWWEPGTDLPGGRSRH